MLSSRSRTNSLGQILFPTTVVFERPTLQQDAGVDDSVSDAGLVDTPDAGLDDAGGEPDIGSSDTSDAGQDDASSLDTGSTDTSDVGQNDANSLDAGPTDTSNGPDIGDSFDTGPADIDNFDTSVADANDELDAGLPDTNSDVDAGADDAAILDVGPIVDPILPTRTNCFDAERNIRGTSIATIPCSEFDHNFSNTQIQLGRLLFFDKILSGNQNIACSTCHHPALGTTDRLSLPVGEVAKASVLIELQGQATNAIVQRIPRNALHLFNLGTSFLEINLFWDARVSTILGNVTDSGFSSPLADRLPLGLQNSVAAVAMLPVLDQHEMAGQEGENSIANAVAADNVELAWQLISERLQAIPEYASRFQNAFGLNSSDEINLCTCSQCYIGIYYHSV